MPPAVTSSSPMRSSRSRAVKAESSPPSVKTEPGVPHSPAITPLKRSRAAKKQEDGAIEDAIKAGDDETIAKVSPAKPSPQLAKKLKQLEMHKQTPFPSHARPTPSDCKNVCEALASVHGGMPSRPLKLEDRPNAAAGCGQVPSVLDALVRTILSQNTTSKNSTAAKKSMDAMFGYGDYEAVRVGEVEDLATALAPGGLANIKAKVIKKVLDSVYERNGGASLSLDDLHAASDEDAMRTLVSFDGVGPKTASCVLLFCLGRESFAVDTHVFRISKALGWVPARADRETAFQHLDYRIPGEYKYALHSLLVRHGRGCSNCSAKGVTSMDFVETCPIKPYLGGKRPAEVGDDEDEDDAVTSSPSKKARKTPSKKKGSKKRAKVESDDDIASSQDAAESTMHGLAT